MAGERAKRRDEKKTKEGRGLRESQNAYGQRSASRKRRGLTFQLFLQQHGCAANCAARYRCSQLEPVEQSGQRALCSAPIPCCAACSANTGRKMRSRHFRLKMLFCSRTRRKLVQRTFIRLLSFTPLGFFKFTLHDERFIFE